MDGGFDITRFTKIGRKKRLAERRMQPNRRGREPKLNGLQRRGDYAGAFKLESSEWHYHTDPLPNR
jgi:hypothetical protein